MHLQSTSQSIVLVHPVDVRSEEHTSELQSPCNLVCRLLLDKKNYKGHVWSGWSALMPRFPTPYAVPIFDVPFALVAVGIGYLCLARHRLRQYVRPAVMGTPL